MRKEYPFRSYDDLYKTISKHAYIIPNEIDMIVGIPRSGIIPAYMLSLIINKPVCSFDEYLNKIDVNHGERELSKISSKSSTVLLVDDSIHSGIQLSKIKNKIENENIEDKILFLAVYARKTSIDLVDFWFEIVDTPRIFQWNYMYQGCVEKSCFDIDGVLCVDPSREENDDGENYKQFLANAKPLYIPNEEIYMLVTSRLEKYRSETEQWLKKHNVRYKHLVMLDLPSKEDRIRLNAHAKFKAEVYRSEERALLFYESERKQAIEIAARTNKPVFCVETGELFNSDSEEVIKYLCSVNKTNLLNGKRILLYTQELTYTGSPHSLLRMAKALKNEGAYVEIWSREEGIFRKEIEKEKIIVKVASDPFLATGKCAKQISQFDLAISNTVLTERFYLAAHNIIPTIWYIREAQNLPSICYSNIERENALKNANELYCVSEYAGDFIRKNYNKDVKVVHNCVEDYFEEGDKNSIGDEINIMAMGTVNYRKAFDIFINSYYEIPEEKRIKIHLYFAGRLLHEIEDYWKPLMLKIDGDSNITFLGELSETKEKIQIMKKMNVFCVVSRDESCSLVALEAAMLGKPIIVSKNVGAQYIVSKDNGWIIDTDSIEALSEVYNEIIDNPKKLIKMGEVSRKKYLDYATIPKYNKSIVKMVLDVLQSSNISYNLQQNEIIRRTEIQLENIQKRLRSCVNKEDEKNKEIVIIENKLLEAEKEIINLQYIINQTRISMTYKIGRIITWGYRKLRHMITGVPE